MGLDGIVNAATNASVKTIVRELRNISTDKQGDNKLETLTMKDLARVSFPALGAKEQNSLKESMCARSQTAFQQQDSLMTSVMEDIKSAGGAAENMRVPDGFSKDLQTDAVTKLLVNEATKFYANHSNAGKEFTVKITSPDGNSTSECTIKPQAIKDAVKEYLTEAWSSYPRLPGAFANVGNFMVGNGELDPQAVYDIVTLGVDAYSASLIAVSVMSAGAAAAPAAGGAVAAGAAKATLGQVVAAAAKNTVSPAVKTLVKEVLMSTVKGTGYAHMKSSFQTQINNLMNDPKMTTEDKQALKALTALNELFGVVTGIKG